MGGLYVLYDGEYVELSGEEYPGVVLYSPPVTP